MSVQLDLLHQGVFPGDLVRWDSFPKWWQSMSRMMRAEMLSELSEFKGKSPKELFWHAASRQQHADSLPPQIRSGAIKLYKSYLATRTVSKRRSA